MAPNTVSMEDFELIDITRPEIDISRASVTTTHCGNLSYIPEENHRTCSIERPVETNDPDFSFHRVDEDVFAEGCKLLLAAARGDVHMIERLLDLRPDHVNFRDYDRRTALHVAASEGHLDVIKILIDKGASVNRSDRWGGSPIDDASRQLQNDVVEYLHQIGGRSGNAEQAKKFIMASFDGDPDEVSNLIKIGTEVDSRDYDSRTALHIAASEGHYKVVNILVRNGAYVNILDRWGGTPLDDAISNKQLRCAEFLAQNGGLKGTRGKPSRMSRNDSYTSLLNSLSHGASLTIDFSELQMIQRIGAGAFGEIYKCRWRGTLVAAKCVKSSKIREQWVEDQPKNHFDMIDALAESLDKDSILADFRIETSILRDLRHPNICMLLGYSTTKDYEVMISELMKCSLLDLLKANSLQNTYIPKRQQIIYAEQLAQGMNYLHTCKPPIIHRDLKPANLLIDYSGVLKIADFGLAKARPKPSSSEKDNFRMTGETGSYRFMAPEVFRHEEYTESVDVYSFAMIFYFILKGSPPWFNLSGIESAKLAAGDGERPILPKHLDKRLMTLLEECWNQNPAFRPSFVEIIEVLSDYLNDVFGMDKNSVVISMVNTKCCAVM